MPQIRENEHVVSRPRLILNDTWLGRLDQEDILIFHIQKLWCRTPLQ